MFGERLKTLRLSHNLSQVELAKQLSVSKQTISNWENNNITPSLDLLCMISRFFSCSADYLLEIDSKLNIIETDDLTPKQIAHIQELVKDMQELNRAINHVRHSMDNSEE